MEEWVAYVLRERKVHPKKAEKTLTKRLYPCTIYQKMPVFCARILGSVDELASIRDSFSKWEETRNLCPPQYLRGPVVGQRVMVGVAGRLSMAELCVRWDRAAPTTHGLVPSEMLVEDRLM
ncbi:hypothetical protein Pcinc_001853 [Petrolisthes cinctipes]|uniref:Uncharacterized protein n=1 Tax=Petrolisthes cinctipes TaxID=88211 RepID=A0AAE1GQW4_PETCI|nr:hypothetical protein Pcinc_001853 [Petrolisthes cinctipes]